MKYRETREIKKHRSKVVVAAMVALMMSSAGDAWADRFVHIESDDILDVTSGTIEPKWDEPPAEDEPAEEGDPDTGDYKCASPSKSKNNKGLGNNCSWCVNDTGTAMESCKCDGGNKNHNDCDVTIEAGSGEFEVWNSEHTELIVEVLKDNGIEPPEEYTSDGASSGSSSTATSPNDVEIKSGRRL